MLISSPTSGFGQERDGRRFTLPGEVHGEVMVFQPMVITEISHSGAKIETSFPFHLESLHDFRLTLGDRSIVVKGRVIHSTISDVDQEQVVYRSGVEFIEPSEPVCAVIDEFIGALKAGHSEP